MATMTTAAYLLKTNYSGDEPMNQAVAGKPLLDMLSKEGGWTGDGFHYLPVETANPQGIADDVGNAQTAEAGSAGEKFAIVRRKKAAVARITGDTLISTADNAGAFAKAWTREVDNVFAEMGDDMDFEVFQDGSGARGKRASASTNVITLTNRFDTRFFKRNMLIQANPTRTGTAGNLRAGSTTVAGTNFAAGTVTLTSAAAITAFADADYMYRANQYDLVPKGFAGWNPQTAEVAGTFYGVTRTTDVEGLQGFRLDAVTAGMSPKEAAINITADMQSFGTLTRPTGWLSPQNWATMQKSLEAQTLRDPSDSTTKFGYEYIVQQTPAGQIKWYAAPNCPSDAGRVIDLDVCYLKYAKQLVHIINDDGNYSLRLNTSDGLETRLRAYWALAVRSPKKLGVFNIG